MVDQATFEKRLQSLPKRRPFQPFVIEFDDGDRYVVEKPEAVWFIDGPTAVFFGPQVADFVLRGGPMS